MFATNRFIISILFWLFISAYVCFTLHPSKARHLLTQKLSTFSVDHHLLWQQNKSFFYAAYRLLKCPNRTLWCNKNICISKGSVGSASIFLFMDGRGKSTHPYQQQPNVIERGNSNSSNKQHAQLYIPFRELTLVPWRVNSWCVRFWEKQKKNGPWISARSRLDTVQAPQAWALAWHKIDALPCEAWGKKSCSWDTFFVRITLMEIQVAVAASPCISELQLELYKSVQYIYSQSTNNMNLQRIILCPKESKNYCAWFINLPEETVDATCCNVAKPLNLTHALS